MPLPPKAVVKSIRLGLIDDNRIDELSAGIFEPAASTRKNISSVNSVLDSRLGTTKNSILCKTCGGSADKCAGHSLKVDLPVPVLNGVFIHLIHKILTCVCFRCSQILIPRDHYKVKRIAKDTGNLRKTLKELYLLALRHRVCLPVDMRENHDGTMLEPEDAIAVGYCGAIQPTRWTRHAIVMARPIFDVDDEDAVPVITNEDVYNIFQNISARDTRILGFDPVASPLSSMCVKSFMIPPVLMRPSRSTFSEDDLTMRLRHISTIIRIWNDDIEQGKEQQSGNLSLLLDNGHVRELITTEVQHTKETAGKFSKGKKTVVPYCISDVYELQRYVSGFVDSRLNVALDWDYGKVRASIRERFCSSKAKSGRMRGTIGGKRSDFSARAVLTPNTNIDPSQIGLPIEICKVLTFKAIVTKFNFQTLLKAVQNGPHVHPGANFIERDGEVKELPGFLSGGLRIGDAVYRHTINGDIVLANRQPTLHRFSLMAYHVRVVKDLTIQIHLAVTEALNADFDGDELNVYSLSSLEAKAEASVILGVNNNMFKDGKLIVGFVQHACLTFLNLTMETKMVVMKRDEAINLLLTGNDERIMNECMARLFGGKMTELPPAASTYTGRDFAQCLLPDYDGTYVLTKRKINSLLALAVDNQWKKNPCQYIGFIVRVLQNQLLMTGASMGIDDILIPCMTDETQDTIANLSAHVESLIEEKNAMLNNGNTDPEVLKHVEESIIEATDKLRGISGDIAIDHLTKQKSSLFKIIHAGAKGNSTHMVQNAALVGQQLDKESNRCARLTSHAGSNMMLEGFVKNSFFDGLSGIEFFFHQQVSRLGLIATAVTTSESGYIYRCIAKCCEDLRSTFNTTIVNATGYIILPYFGFDTDRLRAQTLQLLKVSDNELHKEYLVDDNEAEVQNLVRIRNLLLEQHHIQKIVYSPLDFATLRDSVLAAKSDDDSCIVLSSSDIISTVRGLWERLVDEYHTPNTIQIEALFFERLSLATIRKSHVHSEVVTMYALSAIIEHVFSKFSRNTLVPGTAVGLIASQNVSSPITQLNLNQFHYAGKGGKLNMGIARIKEIIHLTKCIATPSMHIFSLVGETIRGINLVQLLLMDVFEGWTYDEANNHLVMHLKRAFLAERRLSPRMVTNHLCNISQEITFSSVQDDVWTVTIHYDDGDAIMAMAMAHSLTHDKRLIAGIKNITDFYENC